MDDHELERDRSGGSALLRFLIALVAVGAVALAVALYVFRGDREPPRMVHEITIVNILPPPPPPPPTPPPQTPKMIEQTPVKEQDLRETPVERPKAEPVKETKLDQPPPGPLSLKGKAEGPGDLFGLGGKPGGTGILGGGGGGSRWGWYASIVEAQIQQALSANAKTRSAVIQLQVRLWADGGGRVTRVQIVSSSGDAAIDAVVRDEVLAGLTLRQPPPKDMPMPIVTRISERRPG
jgi:outer membrane biosynthesis protein TonB